MVFLTRNGNGETCVNDLPACELCGPRDERRLNCFMKHEKGLHAIALL